MAQMIINIPDDKLQDILDTLCAHYGYKDDSGMTKAQFVKQEIIKVIRGIYSLQKTQDILRAQQSQQYNLDLS